MKIAFEFVEGAIQLHSKTIFEERIVNILEKVEGVSAALIFGKYRVVCFKGVLFEDEEIVENIKKVLSKEYGEIDFEILPKETFVFTQKEEKVEIELKEGAAIFHSESQEKVYNALIKSNLVAVASYNFNGQKTNKYSSDWAADMVTGISRNDKGQVCLQRMEGFEEDSLFLEEIKKALYKVFEKNEVSIKKPATP